jgi:hypothetical protein
MSSLSDILNEHTESFVKNLFDAVDSGSYREVSHRRSFQPASTARRGEDDNVERSGSRSAYFRPHFIYPNKIPNAYVGMLLDAGGGRTRVMRATGTTRTTKAERGARLGAGGAAAKTKQRTAAGRRPRKKNMWTGVDRLIKSGITARLERKTRGTVCTTALATVPVPAMATAAAPASVTVRISVGRDVATAVIGATVKECSLPRCSLGVCRFHHRPGHWHRRCRPCAPIRHLRWAHRRPHRQCRPALHRAWAIASHRGRKGRGPWPRAHRYQRRRRQGRRRGRRQSGRRQSGRRRWVRPRRPRGRCSSGRRSMGTACTCRRRGLRGRRNPASSSRRARRCRRG